MNKHFDKKQFPAMPLGCRQNGAVLAVLASFLDGLEACERGSRLQHRHQRQWIHQEYVLTEARCEDLFQHWSFLAIMSYLYRQNIGFCTSVFAGAFRKILVSMGPVAVLDFVGASDEKRPTLASKIQLQLQIFKTQSLEASELG